MHEWTEIGLRSILAVFTLFAFTKMMGRKELAQMSIFDHIIGISIGSICAQMAFDTAEPWYEFLIVMVVFVGIHHVVTWLTIKSLWARKFFEGAPIILVQDGKIIEKNLRRVKYDVNTFLEECRLEGYFDIGDVHTAIMESSGTVSFIKKVEDESQQQTLVANLIIDGNIMESNLKELYKDKEWLKGEVEKQGHIVEDILLATYNHKKELKFYFKKEEVDVQHILE